MPADDCQSCMCPGSVVDGAINVFASTCTLNVDGTHTCINCTEGHQGNNCETCIPDFYGTPENITVYNPGILGVIELKPKLFQNNGGRCVPCECNGRADTCDSVTGICVDCRNNTSGKECEICDQPYFGTAMDYACKREARQLCTCTRSPCLIVNCSLQYATAQTPVP